MFKTPVVWWLVWVSKTNQYIKGIKGYYHNPWTGNPILNHPVVQTVASQKTRATVTFSSYQFWRDLHEISWNPSIEIPSFFLVNSHPNFFRFCAEDWVTSITASDQAVSQSLDLQGKGKSMGYFHAKMNRMFGNVWDIKGYVVFINWTIYFWYNLLGHLWDTEIFHGFCGDQYNAHNGM